MSDLVERLRSAHENSQQRILGSDIFKEAADEIERLKLAQPLYSRQQLIAENERLKAALAACASDWSSEPGTVMTAAYELQKEFGRRVQIAFDALHPDQQTQKDHA